MMTPSNDELHWEKLDDKVNVTVDTHCDEEENDLLLSNKTHQDDFLGNDLTEMDDGGLSSVGLLFNVKFLAAIVLALLAASHILLLSQCAIAFMKQTNKPIVRKYRLVTNHTTLPIYKHADDHASSLGEVDPGEIVEMYERNDSEHFHRILEPYLGFVKRISPHTGEPYFVPLEEDGEDSRLSFCPLMYEGWWPEDDTYLSYFLFAPTCLVISQQLWNGMQVFALYLVIALNYCHSTSDEDGTYLFWHKMTNYESALRIAFKWGTRLLSVTMLAILPFSIYIVSPGGHIFATSTLILSLVGIHFTPRPKLSLELREDCPHQMGRSLSPTWTIGWEETLAFFCNLGSSLYNYVGTTGVWPHWRTQFYKVDHYFGWKDWGDVIVEGDYTILGLFARARLPLFVPRGLGGTTFGGQVFLVVWSIQPFLYVSYFICMFVLSRKSPGIHIQRALCLFGICHFLFFTDLVEYRYGRGLHNPYDDIFHWTEKWSWRIAVLLPIYQNCTNGHWEHGNKRLPILGKLLRWALIIWGVWFFIFQVINSDVFKTYQFIRGLPSENLLHKLGLNHKPILRHFGYPYFKSVRNMWLFYGLLSLSALCPYGFTLFRICLGGATIATTETPVDCKAASANLHTTSLELKELIAVVKEDSDQGVDEETQS